MALLYMDGFEGYATLSDLTLSGATNPCRIASAASGTLNAVTYRTTQPTPASSRSLSITGASMGHITLATQASTELIIGFGINFYSGTSLRSFIAIGGPSPRNASTGIVLTYHPGSGVIAAHTNSGGNPGTLLGTLSGTYSLNQWYHVEIRIKVGAATGELQVKVDSVDALNLTSINTATGSLANYTGISFYTGGSSVYPSFYLDDLYICDTDGSVNNTFLGPVSVFSLMANGAGSSTQLTAVGAATNWQAVSEYPPDTTTYVETSVTAQKDYYTFEDLPAGITVVNGATIRARSTTVTAGGRKVKLLMKNGANVLSSALRTLTLGSWFDDFMLSETAPDGSAWTKAAVDSTECGVEAQ